MTIGHDFLGPRVATFRSSEHGAPYLQALTE